ncbi:MAG: hypothetical protein COB53_12910, partial [Elusimicrobia bacterium]
MEDENYKGSSEGAPIESGSFRVDRKRALEKLMRFQMPDAQLFLLPWIRAAAASGATAVWIKHANGGLEISFDGRPWTGEELRDPYRWLFVEEGQAAAAARNRELAVGILTALRLHPKVIALQFRQNNSLRVLRVDDLHHETLAEIPDLAGQASAPGQENVQMRIRVQKLGRFDAAIGHLEKRCRRCPIKIEIDHRVLYEDKPIVSRDFEKKFSEGPLSGTVWLSPRAFVSSRIEWVILGTTIAVEQIVLPGVQVAAVLSHDGLGKTASQVGVVKNALYQNCMRVLAAQTASLLEQVQAELEFHSASLFGALRRPEYRREWMPWEEQSTGESVLSGLLDMRELAGEMLPGRAEVVSQDRRLRDTVRRYSLAMASARAAALVHRSDMQTEEALQALWDHAVILSTQGRPTSLRAFEEQRGWLGCVPFLDSTMPEPVEGVLCAWTPRETDRRFLEDFFSGNVRPIASIADIEPPRAEGRPTVTDTNLLIRIPFERGRATGEFGLSLSPHPRNSRIRWMKSGHSFGTDVWPLGGLRIEAAIDDPGLPGPPNPHRVDGPVMRTIADLLELIPEAYRRLAEEYDCEDPGPRDAIIREHLLDLSCDSWDGASERWKSNEWLDSVALFRERGGRMVTMREIRQAAAQRVPLSLFVSSHPDQQLEMMQGYPKHLKRLFTGSMLIKGLIPNHGSEAPPPPLVVNPSIKIIQSVQVEPGNNSASSPSRAPAPVMPGISESPVMLLRNTLLAWSRQPHGKEISAMLPRAARILEKRETVDALEAAHWVGLLESSGEGDPKRGYLLAASFAALRR